MRVFLFVFGSNEAYDHLTLFTTRFCVYVYFHERDFFVMLVDALHWRGSKALAMLVELITYKNRRFFDFIVDSLFFITLYRFVDLEV